MSDEDDDKVRRVIQHIFAPDWGQALGKRIGEGIKAHTGDDFRARASAAARRYVDTVDPAAARARQDQEIADNKQKIEIMQKYANQPPRDGGEIDGPEPAQQAATQAAPRQAIQMQREFSNDQEKEAYLERIRQAQQNAAK